MTLAAFLLVLLLPTTAFAQMACSDRDKFLKDMDAGYTEQPVAMGLAAIGSVIEVLVSEKGA